MARRTAQNVSFFAAPKPFRGLITAIQRNAIQSWLALGDGCDVHLIGNDEGISEMAAEFGLPHSPDVTCNTFGTPLMSSIFELGQTAARSELVCYINADIMLLDDFLPATAQLAFREFLMVSRRWDVDFREQVDFQSATWREHIKETVRRSGVLQIPNAMDLFMFRKGTLPNLPPFAVGRPGWDNWLLYSTWKSGVPVIDATNVVTVVHQNHDYAHVPKREGLQWEGPEAQQNRELMGKIRGYRFCILDATHVLTEVGVKRAIAREYLRRRWRRIPLLHPRLAPLFWAVHRLLRSLLRVMRREPSAASRRT